MLCYINLEALMFSMIKSKDLCEVQTLFSFVATRHFTEKNCFVSITFPELQLNKPNQT